jgi:outer membrane protein TolC
MFAGGLILVLVMGTGGPVSAEAAGLTLENAVQIALSKNAELRASEKVVQGAEYDVRSSYGKFLPQVDVEGSYTRLDAPLEIQMDDMRTAIIAADAATLQATGANPLVVAGLKNALNAALPPFTLQIQKETYYNATASLVQPLYTGGKLVANTKARKADLRIAREQSRFVRNQVVIDVVTSYCRVQLMKDIVATRKETVEGIQQHQNNAEKLFHEGLLSKAGKMRVDVALAEAKREYAKSLRDQELAIILLNDALGTDVGNCALVTPLGMPGGWKDVERYVAAGASNNPNLRVLAEKKELLKQKYTAAYANFLPQVAVFGDYALYQKDLTVFDPQWAAGVAVKINLFDGVADRNAMQATKREIGAIDLYAENAANLVRTGIRKYYHDFETAREQYESVQVSRELAEENLRLNRLSFREGVAPVVDVIDAELSLGKVKVEQSKAQNDYAVALVNLMGTVGDAMEFLGPYAAAQK